MLSESEKENLIMLIKANSYRLNPVQTNIKPRLPRLTGMKSIIFDIYGTLFLSSSGEISTANDMTKEGIFIKTLKTAGFVINNTTLCESGISLFYGAVKQEHHRLKSTGIDYPEVDILEIWTGVLSALIGENVISGKLDRRKLLKTAVIFEALSNPVWEMPGLSEILDLLKDYGFLMGIISNAQFYTPLLFKAIINRDMDSFGFKEELVYFSYCFKRAKPSSFMFEKLKEQLYNNYGIKEDEVLYVGNDMLNDIKTAYVCGFKTALFAGDSRSLRLREDVCKDIVPDVILSELEQIKDVLL